MCRLLCFPMWNSWQFITARVKSWALTVAWEIFAQRWNTFFEVKTAKFIYCRLHSAAQCKLFITLSYPVSIRMHLWSDRELSRCQRFNRLAINTSDAPSVKLPHLLPPSSFSSSNVREAASNGAILRWAHVACELVCECVFFFFYDSGISLQLSIIHTEKATHLTRTHTGTRTSSCSHYTSGCVLVCVHLALYAAA